MLDVLEHSANPIKLLKSISKKYCYPNSDSFKSKIIIHFNNVKEMWI